MKTYLLILILILFATSGIAGNFTTTSYSTSHAEWSSLFNTTTTTNFIIPNQGIWEASANTTTTNYAFYITPFKIAGNFIETVIYAVSDAMGSIFFAMLLLMPSYSLLFIYLSKNMYKMYLQIGFLLMALICMVYDVSLIQLMIQDYVISASLATINLTIFKVLSYVLYFVFVYVFIYLLTSSIKELNKRGVYNGEY